MDHLNEAFRETERVTRLEHEAKTLGRMVNQTNGQPPIVLCDDVTGLLLPFSRAKGEKDAPYRGIFICLLQIKPI